MLTHFIDVLIISSVQQFFSDLFPSYSQDASDINILFMKYLVFAAFMVTLIATILVTVVIKFRSTKRPDEPQQVFGHKRLEIYWTVLPFIIITIFFFLTLQTLKIINKPVPRGRKPDIVIIAHQWWWDMQYPKYNMITANELHIPVGKQLLMAVKSADVVHDWWVQALGPKIDAVPGRTNYNWISADKAGTYLGACAEYCGVEHAHMRIRVIAEPDSAYRKWIASQQTTPEVNPHDSVAEKGYELVKAKTCLDCHSITPGMNSVQIGPNLSHLGSRQTLLSGMLPNTNENLTKWLKDPQKVKPGALMPNFMLSKEEINAMVTYLEGLK